MKYGDFKHAECIDGATARSPFAAAQRLPITPSRCFLRGLGAAHLAVAGLLLGELGHQPLAWLLALGLGLHVPFLAACWRQEARLFVAAQLDPDGKWWLVTQAGTLLPAKLGGTRFVTAWWLLLPLALERGRGGVTLCLMRDNLPHQHFRRLRVRLLWGRAG